MKHVRVKLAEKKKPSHNIVSKSRCVPIHQQDVKSCILFMSQSRPELVDGKRDGGGGWVLKEARIQFGHSCDTLVATHGLLYNKFLVLLFV